MDASDWGEVFADLVSPEISERFKIKMLKTFNDNEQWDVRAGPPKTMARCLAKGSEYMSEFVKEPHLPRWVKFGNVFQNVFHRKPSKPVDFVFTIKAREDGPCFPSAMTSTR